MPSAPLCHSPVPKNLWHLAHTRSLSVTQGCVVCLSAPCFPITQPPLLTHFGLHTPLCCTALLGTKFVFYSHWFCQENSPLSFYLFISFIKEQSGRGVPRGSLKGNACISVMKFEGGGKCYELLHTLQKVCPIIKLSKWKPGIVYSKMVLYF